MEELRNKDAAETADSQIELKVTGNKMAVMLSCTADYASGPKPVEDIRDRLMAMRVRSEPDWVHLGSVLDEAKRTGKGIADLTIVEGEPPVMPVDGRLEWTRDYFAEGYYVDPETQRMDFHQKLAVPTVEKGELLVIVHPPTLGKEGHDVFGASIRVPKPKRPVVRAGSNVSWDEKESGFRACCPGRAKLVGMTLNVEDVYHVRGDVGSDTGNIVHNGQVVIDGNVVSEFKVEATGDIEVRGMAGACDINCGGSLTVRGGIRGNLEKKIKVKGNIDSRYIISADIECEGNINADREIFQSTVRAAGEVNCEGRIVGGSATAAKDITVGEVGLKENTATVLIAGVDYRAQQSLKINLDEIAELKKALKQLQTPFKQLEMLKKTLDHVQREGLVQIEFKIREVQDEIGRLEEENKGIRKSICANKDAQIKVLNMAYPGSTLRVFDSQYAVEHALAGPIYARIDSATAEIALSSDTEEETE